MDFKVRTPFLLMGLPIHPVDPGDVRAFIVDRISQKGKAVVLHSNIQGALLALKHPWLYEFNKQAHLVFCDSDGVRWGLKLLGYSPPPKITYNVWIWQLAEFCSKKKYRLFLLGAASGIAEEAAKRMQSRYPGIQIAGVHHGFFDKKGPENEKIIDRINAAQADILLVCFGMPLQERWLMENVKRLKAHIFLTGGAALDYASGRLKIAPPWIVQLQMEWLFRFMQEPRRLFARYFLGIPYFFLRVWIEKIRMRKVAKNA